MMLMSADTLMELARMRMEEDQAAAERDRLLRSVELEPQAPTESRQRGRRRRWSLP